MISAMLLSMLVFFVNEGKIEFNRGEAYQQICWSLFAIFLVAAQAFVPSPVASSVARFRRVYPVMLGPRLELSGGDLRRPTSAGQDIEHKYRDPLD